jgi:hypothetical protein
MKNGFILCFFLLFINTFLPAEPAPVTTAEAVTNAVPGDPAVPVSVRVNDFVDIGKFTLTLKFDTLKVRYVSSSTNPSLPGMTVTYTPSSTNTTGKIILAWTGASNISLADGAGIAGLVFRYVNGTGNLNWAYTYGSVCQYQRYVSNVLTTLSDSPKYLYYHNGGISCRAAPAIFAPVVLDPVSGPLPLPVTVNDFNDIGGFTLYMEYNPSMLSFLNTFSKHPAFDSNFLVTDNAGFNGNRLIIIQWYGYSLSLADGDTLCTLDFSYLTPTCESSLLSWYDNGPTCEYADGASNILIDVPGDIFYADGMVGPGLPATWTGNLNSNWNDPGNWDECGIPDPVRNVVIPNVSPAPFPVISTEVHCKSLLIQSGAMVTISQAGMVVVGE